MHEESPHPSNLIRSAVTQVLSTWLPPRCVLSGELLAPGELLAGSLLQSVVVDAHSNDDAVQAVFSYGGALADLIRMAKFHPDESAARILVALWSKEAAARVQTMGDVDGVTYVAAHWRRRAQRGFDLPALLAFGLAQQLGVDVVHALKCVRHQAPHSAGRDRAARLTASKGRFVAEGGLEQRAFVLVDDVVTTGATLEEVSRVLREAGACVHPLVLARADHLAALD